MTKNLELNACVECYNPDDWKWSAVGLQIHVCWTKMTSVDLRKDVRTAVLRVTSWDDVAQDFFEPRIFGSNNDKRFLGVLDGSSLPPVVEPRGLPMNASRLYATWFREFKESMTCSGWITLKEALEFDWTDEHRVAASNFLTYAVPFMQELAKVKNLEVDQVRYIWHLYDRTKMQDLGVKP